METGGGIGDKVTFRLQVCCSRSVRAHEGNADSTTNGEVNSNKSPSRLYRVVILTDVPVDADVRQEPG